MLQQLAHPVQTVGAKHLLAQHITTPALCGASLIEWLITFSEFNGTMFLFPAILATGSALLLLLSGAKHLTHNENLLKLLLLLLSGAILLWLLWYQARNKQDQRAIACIAGIQILSGLTIAFVLAGCGVVLEALWQKRDFLLPNLSLRLLWAAGVLSLTAAAIEELLFRGLLLGLLLRWRQGGKLWTGFAVLAQATLFAWIHAISDSTTPVFDGLAVWTGALILGVTVVFSKRLWLAIGIHAGWNAVQYIAFGVQKPNLDYLPGLFLTTPISPGWITVTWGLIGVVLFWLMRWRDGIFRGR